MKQLTKWEQTVVMSHKAPLAKYKCKIANRALRAEARGVMADILGVISAMFQQKYWARIRAATPDELHRLIQFLEED